MIKVVNHFKDGSSKELFLVQPENDKELQLFMDLNRQDDEFKCKLSEVTIGITLAESISDDLTADLEITATDDISCNLGALDIEKVIVKSAREIKEEIDKGLEEELDRKEFMTAMNKKHKYEGQPLSTIGIVYDEQNIPKYRAYVKCNECNAKIKNHVYADETFVRCRKCGTTHNISKYREDLSKPDDYGNYFVIPIYTEKAKTEYAERQHEEIKAGRPIFMSKDPSDKGETSIEQMMKKALGKKAKYQ